MRICCPGFFDLIHPGHERFLRNLASEYGDVRVVILDGDLHRLEGVRLTPEKARLPDRATAGRIPRYGRADCSGWRGYRVV